MGRIFRDQWLDTLVGPDRTRYLVQKEWSNKDNAPVAFAEPSRVSGNRVGSKRVFR